MGAAGSLAKIGLTAPRDTRVHVFGSRHGECAKLQRDDDPTDLVMNTPRLPDMMRFHPILVGVVVAASLAALATALVYFIDANRAQAESQLDSRNASA